MPTKRELVLDAAIEVLGSRGPRALTHRAVDEAATMASGSTSNYFRTREALLIGISERLEERDYSDWETLSRMPIPATLDQLIDTLAGLVGHFAGADRTRTLARYALILEAQTAPPIQQSIQRGHQRLTDWGTVMLRNIDPRADVAQLLVDYMDGAVMHQLYSPATEFDPRPALDRLARALLPQPHTSS
ncbi:TetR family transcriptional regulator [Nocardia sp. NPDC050712]|uniref:TetR/AcrR family transcriptional regulator n=1 Tax=Nocardia sp. NPDC050712 TaxID=3155518 RepID=UPI0033C996F3